MRELVGYGVYNMLIGHINKQSPAQLLLDREPAADDEPDGVGPNLNVLRIDDHDGVRAAHAQPSRCAERVRHAALRRVRVGVPRRRARATTSRASCSPAPGARSPPARTSARCRASTRPARPRPTPATPGPGFPRFIDTVAAFEKPLIAAVNGLGVGIGMTVLLHCDLVLIARGARLRAPFVPLGVVPEAAGSLLMPA